MKWKGSPEMTEWNALSLWQSWNAVVNETVDWNYQEQVRLTYQPHSQDLSSFHPRASKRREIIINIFFGVFDIFPWSQLIYCDTCKISYSFWQILPFQTGFKKDKFRFGYTSSCFAGTSHFVGHWSNLNQGRSSFAPSMVGGWKTHGMRLIDLQDHHGIQLLVAWRMF